MALIVQKFGGSSVADAEKLRRAAEILAETYKKGNDVVAVLSAQGKTTDRLLAQAAEVAPDASPRELDALLATGEQASAALGAMAVARLGVPAVSLTGWQAGLRTVGAHGAARVLRLEGDRIARELKKKNLVIVAGFQGFDVRDDVTTLGRGGSDTTAAALAAALHADLCQIYTDVDGVFTADPRVVPSARKLREISCDEMLELASLGAKVLHNRSVELSRRFGVPLEVLSAFSRRPGTVVRGGAALEQPAVSGAALDRSAVRFVLSGLEDTPGAAWRIFSLLGREGVAADMLQASMGGGKTREVAFTVSEKDSRRCEALLRENRDALRFEQIGVRAGLSKVSLVGAGLTGNPAVAAQLFSALFEAGVAVHMVSTGETRVSVLVDEADAERALRAVHAKFFPRPE